MPDYNVTVNHILKVLDFIQFGGHPQAGRATDFHPERTRYLPDAGLFGRGVIRCLVSLYLLYL